MSHSGKIRDPEFAARLEQACEQHPDTPAKNAGRLQWMKHELERRYDVRVSLESVRKWFAGESRPKADKIRAIAQLLGVDDKWLRDGVAGHSTPPDHEGAVYLITGLIRMDGGQTIFTTLEDPDDVDLYAIIQGVRYTMHITVGEVEGYHVTFTVPARHEEICVIGVLKRELEIDLVEVPSSLVAKHGHVDGGVVRATIPRYELEPHNIKDFSTRL